MRRFALVVGIEAYRDAGIAPLRYAVRDAMALAEALSSTCRFDDVRVLAGEEGPEEPTAANVLIALDGLTKDAEDGDAFLFFFAGHGIERDKHTWLLTRDAYSGSPRVGSLPLADLQDALPRHVGARILLIDACRNSPYAARGDLPNTLSEVVARDVKAAARRSTKQHGTTAVLFACGPGQRAYEWPAKGHGVFTHYLLEGLRRRPPEPPWTQSGLTIQGLASHVSDRVGRWSARSPNLPLPQQPWFFQEGRPGEILLAAYAGAAASTAAGNLTGVVEPSRGRAESRDSSVAPHTTPAAPLAPRARLVALKKAISANDVGAVEMAIGAGVDVDSVDAVGSRPLHLAAKVADDSGIIRALIEAGADVNAVDRDGRTPLGIAAHGNANPDVHRALVSAGADVEGCSAFTPLMAAAALNSPEIVRALIDLHADHEARDDRGRTPLMWAAWKNRSVAVTQALLDTCVSGGNYVLGIDDKSHDGTTALGYALEGLEHDVASSTDIIQALLGAGANPHIATHPRTAKTAMQTALECGAGNPLYQAVQPYASGVPAPTQPVRSQPDQPQRASTWTTSNALTSFSIVMSAGLLSAALAYSLAPAQLPDSLLGSALVYALVIVGGVLLTFFGVVGIPSGIISEVTKTPAVLDEASGSAGRRVAWLVPLGWVPVSIGAAFVPVRFDLALAAGVILLAGVHGLTYFVAPPVPYVKKRMRPRQLISSWTRKHAVVSVVVVAGLGVAWGALLWELAPSGSERLQAADVALVIGLCLLASLISYYVVDGLIMRLTGSYWDRSDENARDHMFSRKTFAYVLACSPALLYGINISHSWQGLAPEDSRGIWPLLGVLIPMLYGYLAFVRYPPVPYSRRRTKSGPGSGTKREPW